MEIPKKIKDSIWDYCKLNDISNIDEFILKMINQGFNIEKYGSTPFSDLIEKEIVEKIVEVPVEVKVIEYKDREIIKEVFVEKEIPVEKIVTKIEYITDKTSEDELFLKIETMEQTINSLNEELKKDKENYTSKKQEMENNFKNELSKKDKELDDIRLKLDDKSKDEKIESLKKEIVNLKNELSKKDKELDNKKEKNNVKKPDIYGEDNKGGFWGSNIMK